MEAKQAEEEKRKQAMDAELSGQYAETVIRDRKGRKLEMLSEFMRQEAVREGLAVERKKEEYEWGRGKVQKDEAEARAKELESIKDQPFARLESDPTLEAERKDEIRAEDPMAQYMMKKITKQARAAGVPEKPVYKGPPPRPNRFNLRPGYRWDGVDRGNGFEDRWFKKQSAMVTRKEDEHRWATSDM